MLKRRSQFFLAAIAGLSLGSSLALPAENALAASLVYDAIGNLDELPSSAAFQAARIDQFGNQIQFANTQRGLQTVRIALVTFGVEEDFEHDITLNLYNTDLSEIVSITETKTMEGFEEDDIDTPWGKANPFLVEFDVTAFDITLPEEIIFGVAYNTQSAGAEPVGTPGPYNSLNVGMYLDTSVSPFIGNVGDMYLQSAEIGSGEFAPYIDPFNDPGTYAIAAQFEAVPEPSLLLGTGLVLGLGTWTRSRRQK